MRLADSLRGRQRCVPRFVVLEGQWSLHSLARGCGCAPTTRGLSSWNQLRYASASRTRLPTELDGGLCPVPGAARELSQRPAEAEPTADSPGCGGTMSCETRLSPGSGPVHAARPHRGPSPNDFRRKSRGPVNSSSHCVGGRSPRRSRSPALEIGMQDGDLF